MFDRFLPLRRRVQLAAVLALAPTARAVAESHPAFAPRQWITSAPVLSAVADDRHPIVSVKDPTVVRHDGRWHVFTTTADTSGEWRMAYFNFASWAEADRAEIFHLDQNPAFDGYNCAPQVFYFRPQQKWYLIFQSQQPRFSTTDDLSDPLSWSEPQDFFAGTPASVVEGWLDYWIICDDTHAYLFFPDDHGRFYRSRTRLIDFPRGFDEPVVVLQEPNAADLFEGSCVYKLKDTNQYLCLVECIGRENGSRYYRAFTADRLDGEWQPLPGADTEVAPFAGNANVSAPGGGERWTDGISHGELLREGVDETMTIDPANLRFLYQGLPVGRAVPEYSQLPYSLALLGSADFVRSVTPASAAMADIRTPPPPATPRINGPTIFGVRPGSPFLYTIPVTGERPMTYAVDDLPAGLAVDAATGRITGRLAAPGEHHVVFRASNALGEAEKPFRIVVGDKIALTPPLGWNSWNSWAGSVDQDKVLRSARALVSSGLANHGWTYVNIDDTWQGERGGPHFAILGNEKFPDMKQLCDEIHALGLKAGIYSSPWVTTYAGFRGGASDAPDGSWTRIEGYDHYQANHRLGAYTFEANDAAQWAEWGFDYLKYDWNPNDVPHTKAMAAALRATGRDIVFSLSNAAPFEDIAELSQYANAWRTTGDIVDVWAPPAPEWWQNSVTEIGFNQDRWVPHGGPGHWNDPDMLVVGWVGWGPNLHPTRLTPAEQYSHISLWAMLASPLLIGCDLERLDPFTLNLLTNDEVLAINQDALGRSAHRVATPGAIEVYRKELEDGSVAVGYFNRGENPQRLPVNVTQLGLGAAPRIRDVWRQQDIAPVEGVLEVTVPGHDVMLYRITPVAVP